MRKFDGVISDITPFIMVNHGTKKKWKIREGSHCSQCGKHIPKGEWSSRHGDRKLYFKLIRGKIRWLYYFCSEKCDKKFWGERK